MTRTLRLAHYAFIVTLAGCASLAPLLSKPTPDSAQQATATPQTVPTATATPVHEIRLLRIWVPPRFDPNAESPAAELFQQRLEQFQDEHPRIQLEIRIKTEADILNILSTTNKAAPASMPDLVALSYSDMQSAAAAGYLHPLSGLTEILEDPDWYAFARELGHFQDSEYGFPFASDALLFVYRPAAFSEIPLSLDKISSSGNQLAMPVSDPQALFVLSLYMSAGGQFITADGKPGLDEEILTQVFSFFEQGRSSGAFPVPVREFKTDKDVLSFYRTGDADIAVTRATADIESRSGNYLPMPGLTGAPYTIGDGWVWALAGGDAEDQELATELASYLVESSYLSKWTMSSGYLPTRPQALNGWDDSELRVSINEVLQSAYPIPSKEVLQTVGPILQEGLIRIFNGEQAEVVARSVVESLK